MEIDDDNYNCLRCHARQTFPEASITRGEQMGTGVEGFVFKLKKYRVFCNPVSSWCGGRYAYLGLVWPSSFNLRWFGNEFFYLKYSMKELK